ncbi:MAG TPA: ATP-binding protein [Rhizomicrobium sp.]|jgi:two-component system phosphate regulon sensor histidine kinase PhoR|nr:ATP-binding protein [Rhizomicrobium sp.]
MTESFLQALSRLRGKSWPFVIGMVAGGAAVLFAGEAMFWALAALALAAALISQFVTFQEPVLSPAVQDSGDPVALLPPQTRLLLEQLPMPVMLLDGAERVVFANQFMREVLGPGLDRKRASAVLRNPDVLAAIAAAGQGEASNVPFTLPVPVERHFQAYAARIGVTPPIIVLLLHDLTAVRRSEQMRADFIANASHELRTPLAAVTGFIDTLRGHARDDEGAREKFLEIMAAETARMRRLINDLLSLTRIEMNEHVPPQDRVDLEGAVRQAAAALIPLAAEEGIAITIALAPGIAALPPVIGDHDELVQLFQNLIHNAIKYGRQDGHVQITMGVQTVPAGERQVFGAVRDDGEGIAPAAIPRLTERFYRVDVKRSRERGGTGLGLAIVKHIVSRHQGRLSIESRLGEGSVFTVFLREAPPEAPAKPVLPEPVTEML